MGYIMELRKMVGPRPLIMAGSCVLVFNEEGHLLLQNVQIAWIGGHLGDQWNQGSRWRKQLRGNCMRKPD